MISALIQVQKATKFYVIARSAKRDVGPKGMPVVQSAPPHPKDAVAYRGDIWDSHQYDKHQFTIQNGRALAGAAEWDYSS